MKIFGPTAAHTLERLVGEVRKLPPEVYPLAQALLQQRPDVKVLYMSGYTDHPMVRRGVVDAGVAFLQKPFTPTSLVSRIRELLETAR